MNTLLASLLVEKTEFPGFSELCSDLATRLEDRFVAATPENIEAGVLHVLNGAAHFQIVGCSDWEKTLVCPVDVGDPEKSPFEIVEKAFRLPTTPKLRPLDYHSRQVRGFSVPIIEGLDFHDTRVLLNNAWDVLIEYFQFLSRQAA